MRLLLIAAVLSPYGPTVERSMSHIEVDPRNGECRCVYLRTVSSNPYDSFTSREESRFYLNSNAAVPITLADGTKALTTRAQLLEALKTTISNEETNPMP